MMGFENRCFSAVDTACVGTRIFCKNALPCYWFIDLFSYQIASIQTFYTALYGQCVGNVNGMWRGWLNTAHLAVTLVQRERVLDEVSFIVPLPSIKI